MNIFGKKFYFKRRIILYKMSKNKKCFRKYVSLWDWQIIAAWKISELFPESNVNVVMNLLLTPFSILKK